MSSASNWQDLMPRVLSGLAMAVAGAVVIWLGGWSFRVFVCAICGLMVWEAARMFDAPRPKADGVLAGMTLFLLVFILSAVVPLPLPIIIPLIFAAAIMSASRAGRDKRLYFGVYVWIVIACLALLVFRNFFALTWIIWLIGVVVATDVAGYFAGRMLGGPKFWPRISPKKTWSGTVAGWVASAGVGVAVVCITGWGWSLIPASVVVSFASQLGDIGESAVKRRAGVKDSSNLIPGHGGVLDRFDGLMGGAVVLLLMVALITLGLVG